MSIDLRGAVVDGPDRFGYFRVRRPGFIHPYYFPIVPGTLEHASGEMMAPANLVPRLDQPTDEVPATTPSGLALREYQREAIRFGLQADGGALFAIGTGLGKSLIASMIAHLRPQWRPILVAGPLLAQQIWVGDDADAFKHCGLRFTSLRTQTPGPDKMPLRTPEGSLIDGYFINFELTDAWGLWLEAAKFKLIIIDESHVLRTAKIRASKTLRKVCRLKTTTKRLLLTATPVVNRVSDLWAQLDAIQPGLWGNKMDWGVRYAGFIPDEKGYAPWVETGETNTRELRQRLSSVMVHVSRFDARGELPAFQREVVKVAGEALEQRYYKRYLSAKRDIVHHVLQGGGSLLGLSLQQANAMHKELSHAKRKPAVEIALDMVAQFGKVVVFCWYKETATAIAKGLEQESDTVVVFGPIDSTKSKTNRDKTAKAFRDFEAGNGPLFDDSTRATISHGALADASRWAGGHVPGPGAVFVATLGTSGMAMNELAAAPAALFVDLYWVPYVLLQAEGRIHREGQQAKQCLVRYMQVAGSIDEIMFDMLTHKANTISAVSGNDEAVSLTEALGGPNATQKSDFEVFAEALRSVHGTGEL